METDTGVRIWAVLTQAVVGAILIPAGVFLATLAVAGPEHVDGLSSPEWHPDSPPVPGAAVGGLVAVVGGGAATATAVLRFVTGTAESLPRRVRLGGSMVMVAVPLLASGAIVAAQRLPGYYMVRDSYGVWTSVPLTVASPLAATGVEVFAVGLAILGIGFASMASSRSQVGKYDR